MAKYTSGPWNIEGSVADSGDRIAHITISPPDNPNADCVEEEYNGCKHVAHCMGPDREANARLIATAPRMFEALKIARDKIFDGLCAQGKEDPITLQLLVALDDIIETVDGK
jgi:hypothetical protein